MRQLVAGLLVGALVSGGIATAAGSPPAGPRSEGPRVVLDLKEVTTQFYFAENPTTYPKPPGRGAGNTIFFSGTLTDWADGTPLGTNHGSCLTVADALTTVTNPEGPGVGVPTPTVGAPPVSLAQCQQTLLLSDGQLLVEGLLDQVAFEGDCVERPLEQFCETPPQPFVVAGGTGAYAGASGTVTLQQVEYPDVIRIRVDVRLPKGAQQPATSAAPAFDTARPVWVDGTQVTGYVQQLREVQEGLPQIDVYLSAPSGSPQDDGSDAPPFVFVPPHDNLVPATVSGYARRANAYGYALVPGPAATADTVRTRDSSGERLGRPSPFPDVMASAVVLDGSEQPFDRPETVQRALDAGLVVAQPLKDPFTGQDSPYGGVIWTE